MDTTDTGAVCVVGMGYVGTSLAAVLAEAGFRVHGVDIDSGIVDTIDKGECPIQEDGITDRFEKYAVDGRITATTQYDVLCDSDTIIVTVGTPLAKADPDISAVKSASVEVGERLCHDDIVVFRSTLPAGATAESIRPLLDKHSGLQAGTDYSLAFCPERMAEGNAYADLTSLPVIVGGLTETCRKRVERFWEGIGQETVPVSSPTAAELTKLADNWWIDLNIALANEVALLSEKLGVDAFEVIRAANTLPKGEHNVNILYPGAGVGGSCLVKDPWFVASLGEENGLNLQTPRVSRQVNTQMEDHMVELVERGVSTLEDTTVAVLGYAFKSGTDDTRNTPARQIIETLVASGSNVRITDPYVPRAAIEKEVGIEPVRLPEALNGADAVVVVTNHEQYQALSFDELDRYVGSDSFVVVDGRNAFAGEPPGGGIEYFGIGRGDVR
jgi:UDP-N-acetyl-D-mannosaminuronic acid dehydrogenase